MAARRSQGELAAEAGALSPRRLAVLTGFFILALGALLTTKFIEEASARRVETELRVAYAAEACANGLDVAIVTGASVRQALGRCSPGGGSAIFHLARNGDILTAFGRTDRLRLDAAAAAALPLDARGDETLDLASGPARASWRPLDNGEAVLVAAPARDIYQRAPIWLAYALILGAITLVVASLMTAFVRQAGAARDAARAIDALGGVYEALQAGRCSPWRYDQETRSVRFLRSFLEPIGLGARDRRFTMREISALTHPEDLRAAVAILTGDNHGPREAAVRLRRPNGAWARVLLRTSEEAGRKARSGVAIDLSGARTPDAGAALAETRLKDAIESIPESFVLWDARGRLAAWNRRFATVFGIDAAALAPGLDIRAVAASARIGRDILSQYFGPDAAIADQSVEVALKPDFWLHISRRQTGEGGLVCVAANVTDMKQRARAQKRKERILRDAVAELEASRRELSETMTKYEVEKYRAEEANRSKSEFLANMSHELRTPLNAINGFGEIMRSELYGPLGDAKYKEYVDDILASASHLLEMIDDILDMSKIEAGKLQLDLRRVELERVLQECARFVTKPAKDAGVTLTVSVAHAPAVHADPRAVKQVALNLLSNAIKFTDRGGEVTLTAEADLDGVAVIVADSGCGVPPDRMKRLGAPFAIFEPHTARARGGSGLGLALSKSLMELQGGLLAATSEPGKGSVFCAAFPRRPNARVRVPAFMRADAHLLTAAAAPRPEATTAPSRKATERKAAEAAE